MQKFPQKIKTTLVRKSNENESGVTFSLSMTHQLAQSKLLREQRPGVSVKIKRSCWLETSVHGAGNIGTG